MLKQEYKEGEMKLADALDLSIKVLSKTLVSQNLRKFDRGLSSSALQACVTLLRHSMFMSFGTTRVHNLFIKLKIFS